MRPGIERLAAAALVTMSLTVASRAQSATEATKALGTVVALRGEVERARANGVQRALELKDRIYPGDRVMTGAGGRVQISFRDGTLLGLGRHTEMRLVDYAFGLDARPARMTISVGRGCFRVLSSVLTEDAAIAFRTGTSQAPICVRGSFYAGRLSERGLSFIALGRGKVTVSSRAVEVTLAKPLFGTTVSSGEAPLPATRVSPQELAGLCPAAPERDGRRKPRKGRGEVSKRLRSFEGWGDWGLAAKAAGRPLSWTRERSFASDARDLVDISRTARFTGGLSGGGSGGCPT